MLREVSVIVESELSDCPYCGKRPTVYGSHFPDPYIKCESIITGPRGCEGAKMWRNKSAWEGKEFREAAAT
jgi:hypothetical protein